MLIDRLEIFHVAMPLLQPWRTSYGEDAAVHSILVRMGSRSAEGWGEASPLAAPCYSPDWAGGAFATLREWLAPAILGQTIESGDELQKRLSPSKATTSLLIDSLNIPTMTSWDLRLDNGEIITI